MAIDRCDPSAGSRDEARCQAGGDGYQPKLMDLDEMIRARPDVLK
jgi:hypothetical protein